jgi:branched-chain amino acid transport system permease protein
MTRDTGKWIIVWLTLVAFVLAPWAADLMGQPFYIAQFRRILIYALAAVSLDLVLGYGRMVSFGHAAFFGIGAYTVGILNFHVGQAPFLGLIPGAIDPLVTWPAAALVGGVLALIIGAISLRTSGIYFIMITLALAQMVFYLFISLKAYGGEDGLRFSGQTDILGLVRTDNELRFYYVVLAVLIVATYGCYRLIHSRFGRVLRGCGENERRMRALGYQTYAYRLVCFVISGALCGLAGAMLATNESYVSPALMHWARSGDMMVMVVLGGMGTLFGPILGATAFVSLEKFLPELTEHWMILFGPMLVLVALFARRGLLHLLSGGQRAGR